MIEGDGDDGGDDGHAKRDRPDPLGFFQSGRMGHPSPPPSSTSEVPPEQPRFRSPRPDFEVLLPNEEPCRKARRRPGVPTADRDTAGTQDPHIEEAMVVVPAPPFGGLLGPIETQLVNPFIPPIETTRRGRIWARRVVEALISASAARGGEFLLQGDDEFAAALIAEAATGRLPECREKEQMRLDSEIIVSRFYADQRPASQIRGELLLPKVDEQRAASQMRLNA